MAAAASGVKSWLLEKYAKQVEVDCRDGPGSGAVESLSSRNSGEWKQISSLEGDGSLQITLIEEKHLMLSSGSQIRESFTLVNTDQWLKTYCKGDSALFVVRMNNGLRRFRVKFAHTGIKTGMDNCMDFVKAALPVLSVKVIPLTDNVEVSQSQFIEDSQTFTTPLSQLSQAVQDVPVGGENSLFREGSSLPDIARQIDIGYIESPVRTIPFHSELAQEIMSNDQAIASTSTNLPTSDLSTLIRLCLSDPGFPNFVEKVEQELKQLTTQK